MKRHSLCCIGFWPMLLLALLLTSLLLLVTLYFKWRDIEQDVAINATQSLQSQNIEWASVNTHDNGRTVIIEGTAPNQDAADDAIKAVKSANGVHRVQFDSEQIAIAPKKPASLNAIVTQDSIVLRGIVKDEATLNKLIDQASAVFGKENVLNKLQVGANIDDLNSIDGLFTIMNGKGNSAPFSASMTGDGLTLNGQVIDSKSKSSIEESIAKLTQLPINNQIKVVLPPIVEEPEPVKEDICLNLVQEILRNGKINFATGKASINEDSFGLLELLADTAKQCPESKFVIEGHTDSSGNLNFNNSLSQKRAESVMTHLIGLGLPTEQFKAIGYGPSQPIANNGTSQGRAQNRRIEFKLQTEQNSTNLGETK